MYFLSILLEKNIFWESYRVFVALWKMTNTKIIESYDLEGHLETTNSISLFKFRNPF